VKFETRAIHAGQPPDAATGATIPPVSFSTTYTQEAPGRHKGFEYSRTRNPTRIALEECLAALEEGEACAAFASGLAAETALFQSLRPGDGVVGGHDLYGGTFRLLERVFRPWGLEIAYARDASAGAYREALRGLKQPRLVWIETPTNPLLDVVDIAAVCAAAREAGAKVGVDNTFASPYLQQQLALGADFSVHSTTKYLGGHSDAVGGAVVAKRNADLEPVRFLQNAAGAVPGPLDCYLVLRGLKTLAVRMERHCSNAARIAKEAASMPGVRRVLYPRECPQMRAGGGMVTLDLDGDAAGFCSRLRVFACAESLGGVESLAGHPVTMTHASIPREIREAKGITDTLVRLSVGIEHVDDLLDDIRQALRR
jgi:cystathionine beta-lyase/cystathionine gamma-synthase